MSAAALSGHRLAALTLHGADRLGAPFASVRGVSRVTMAVLVGSATLHLILVAAAIVTSRAPIMVSEPPATMVEVVQEVPKAESPKAEPLKTKAVKAEPPKAETLQAEAPKPMPKVMAPPPPAKVAAPKPEDLQKAADEREALAKELAALRAQQAKLEARQASGDLGMGPLPDSFQAVALPSSTTGAGEAMDYKDLVFSQLAKARGFDKRMGLPGTAGVHFVVDAAGHLDSVEIVAPSGVAALDAEAIAIVRRAAPFPAPPQGALRSFVANVNFVAQDK